MVVAVTVRATVVRTSAVGASSVFRTVGTAVVPRTTLVTPMPLMLVISRMSWISGVGEGPLDGAGQLRDQQRVHEAVVVEVGLVHGEGDAQNGVVAEFAGPPQSPSTLVRPLCPSAPRT